MNPSELEGDLKEWGEEVERLAKGLDVLNYPSGSQKEFISGTGRPPIPDYYPKHQIRALGNTIEGLVAKYRNILILRYILKMKDREIGRSGECDRGTVPDRVEKAKHLLVKSKYWKL